MATTADFRNSMTIVLDGLLFSIMEFQHVKPGKGSAFVRTKLKNVRTKAVVEKTFRAGEKVEEARLERHKLEYLYESGGLYYFMNLETYEQLPLPSDFIGDTKKHLKENITVEILFEGSEPIEISLPFFVELKVTNTDPGYKGDTAQGGNKPATLETGAVVQVPLFINIGDILKIDTRSNTYIERVS